MVFNATVVFSMGAVIIIVFLIMCLYLPRIVYYYLYYTNKLPDKGIDL
jgi:hypothetical protein